MKPEERLISLVVPAYNERPNIEPLVERVGKALEACGEPFELIIVDDSSPDGTAEEVRRLSASRPWLRVLVRENERDLSTAVIAGWRVAQGEVLGCMDADLQQPPELIPKLFRRLTESGADIAVASRHVAGGGVSDWSLLRRFISWTATLMASFILPGTLSEVHDPMSGYFLVRKPVVADAPLNPVGYKILLEVLAKGDYNRAVEVPYTFEERRRGGSKMGAATVLKYLAHLLRISLETGESWRLVKYAMVGTTGAVVNFVSLRWLAESRHWRTPLAALAGAGLAICNNFVWNELFTFWETRKADPGLTRLVRRFLAFVMFSAAGVGLNVVLIAVLVAGFGMRLEPGVVIGIGVAALWNFFTNSNITWRAWWNRKALSGTARRVASAAADVAATAPPEGLEFVPCNLCRSQPYVVLYAGNSHGAAEPGAQAFRCTSEEHGDFTNIVQCKNCGLIYENPRERETAIEAQYAEVEDPTYERETGGRIRTFSKLLDRLQTFAPASGRLLDVGSYTGVFLELAAGRGWKPVGVEPSRWAARRARERALEVINAPLREARLESQSFDVVTIWDVIEHLHDPLGQLREVHRLLRPNGLLGLSTMDAGCLWARLAGRRWPWYMRMHLYYFTRGTLTRMLQEAGFQVLEIERHKRIVSLRYLLEKGFSLLHPVAPLGRWLGAPFGNTYVTVDLGDIMNIYARRREDSTP